ncbi:MAG TPA: DUF305 domain-containing protein [Jatrophihabitans sp.]|jgi:uncharacterized protein (DUF305 family)
MTEPATVLEPEVTQGSSSRGLRLVLTVVVVVVALLVAGTVGWLIRGGGSSLVSASSVDAGFARDMATHHEQAVTMASYTRDHTDNAQIKTLAYDIEETQKFEVGRMSGWLDAWGLSRVDSSQAPMAWMGHDHMQMGAGNLMPGMATQQQMTELQSSTGTKLDILFLQLMIHHHQGGIPMAQYAAAHASKDYVRTAAQAMVTNQSSEIIAMGQLLRQLGGSELQPPS